MHPHYYNAYPHQQYPPQQHPGYYQQAPAPYAQNAGYQGYAQGYGYPGQAQPPYSQPYNSAPYHQYYSAAAVAASSDAPLYPPASHKGQQAVESKVEETAPSVDADQPLYPPSDAVDKPLYGDNKPAPQPAAGPSKPLYVPSQPLYTPPASGMSTPTPLEGKSESTTASGPNQGEEASDAPKYLDIGGNSATMNLPEQMYQNIIASQDYRSLMECQTVPEVLEEFDKNVTSLEPWHQWSDPTYAFMLMLRMFKIKATTTQMVKILKNKNPYIRALGLLYLRFSLPPKQLWNWYEHMLTDDEEFDLSVKRKTTVAILARELLSEPKYFEIVLPRIPVPVERDLKQKLIELGPINYIPRAPSGQKRGRNRDDSKPRGENRRKRSRSKSPTDGSAPKRTKLDEQPVEPEPEIAGPSVEEKFSAAAPKKVMTKEEVMRLKSVYGDSANKPGDPEPKDKGAPSWDGETQSFSIGSKR